MDAPRALLNAMAWLIGRHNQGFHFADLDLAICLGNVGVVLVGMGSTSVSQTASEESPLKRVPERVCLRHYAHPKAWAVEDEPLSRGQATHRLTSSTWWAPPVIEGFVGRASPRQGRGGFHELRKANFTRTKPKGSLPTVYVEVGKTRGGQGPPDDCSARCHRTPAASKWTNPMRGPKVPPMRG